MLSLQLYSYLIELFVGGSITEHFEVTEPHLLSRLSPRFKL